MARSDLVHYVEAALRLKEALDFNQKDADFIKNVDVIGEEREIVYIFDTNVFIFYAYLDDEKDLTADLRALVGENLEPDVSRAMERLTADFMFSGNLPGQLKKSGYISVPHLEETLRTAEAIGKTLDDAHIGSRAAAAISESDVAQIVRILESDKSTIEKVEDLSLIVPAAWLATLNSSTRFYSGIRKAFANPKFLVPLDQWPDGKAAGLVDLDDMHDWMELLLQVIDKRTDDIEVDETNITADAKTLATIVNLYRNDPESRGPKARRRYLFVTTDSIIAQAVRDNLKELRKDGIDNFVRSPRDYLPILNLTSMREAMSVTPMTARIRQEFRTVFDTLRSALDWIVTGQRVAQPDALSSAMLERVRRRWSEIAKYVTTLNAYIVSPDHRRMFEELKAFVTHPDTAVAAARLVREAVEEVRDEHLEMMVKAAISAIAAVNKVRDMGRPVQIRAQIKLVGPLFGDMLKGKGSINDFLREAVKDGALPDDTIQELKTTPGTRETQLLAACLFVAAEQWKTAADFASHAVKLSSRDSAFACEARYLRALCLRFSMDRAEHYERARRDLIRNLREYGSNPAMKLRAVRDQIELGSLMVTAAVMQDISAIQEDPGEGLVLIENGKSADVFRDGVMSLDVARETLRDPKLPGARLSGMTKAERQALLESLWYQCTINLVGAFAFERILPSPKRGDYALTGVLPLLNAMHAWIASELRAGRDPRRTAKVYISITEAHLARTVEQRRIALTDAKREIGNRKPRRGEMPLSDFLEFTFIWDWAQSQLELIEATASPEILSVD